MNDDKGFTQEDFDNLSNEELEKINNSFKGLPALDPNDKDGIESQWFTHPTTNEAIECFVMAQRYWTEMDDRGREVACRTRHYRFDDPMKPGEDDSFMSYTKKCVIPTGCNVSIDKVRCSDESINFFDRYEQLRQQGIIADIDDKAIKEYGESK